MNRGLSLWLDLLRFGLALIVCLGHASYRGYVGHPFLFWFTYPYGQTAVVGFFVLSGFVIAHVSMAKESDPKTYAAARISRLYSVVIPALLLTAFLDEAGRAIDPTLYLSGPAALGDNQILRYVATFFLVHDYSFFSTDMSPGTNGAFWSLSLEATYYLVFGFFLTRRWLLAAAGSAAVFWAAGIFTFGLFPCWLLGVGLYHLNRRLTVSPWLAAAIFAISIVSIVMVGWLRNSHEFEITHRYGLRYVEAAFFAFNIFAAANLSGLFVKLLGWWEPIVRWLGSLTFALYLSHRPALQFFATARLGEPGTPLQHLWLFGMTALVVIAMAHLGEWLRRAMRRRLLRNPKPQFATADASP